LIQCNSVFHRIWAAKQLIKTGTKDAFDKLRNAIKQEKFYGVIIEIASYLGELKSIYALEVLIDMLETVHHPRALGSVALACQKFKSPYLRNQLLKFLSRPALPYRALSRALHALGHQGEAKDFEILKEYIEGKCDGGYAKVVISGALSGLAALRSEQAFEYVHRLTKYGTLNDQVRPGSITALASLGSWLEGKYKKIAIEAVEILLLDEDKAIKRAAVEGLVTLQSRGSINAMNSIRSQFTRANRVWLERKIASLSREDSVSNLTKKLEAMESQIQALQSQLSELSAANKSKL